MNIAYKPYFDVLASGVSFCDQLAAKDAEIAALRSAAKLAKAALTVLDATDRFNGTRHPAGAVPRAINALDAALEMSGGVK